MPHASRKYTNPFYVLLVLAGIAFCVTACAYGMMTVRALRPEVAGTIDAVHPLVRWLDLHGFQAMMAELALLGFCTVAAIGTDEFWARRRGSSRRVRRQPAPGAVKQPQPTASRASSQPAISETDR